MREKRPCNVPPENRKGGSGWRVMTPKIKRDYLRYRKDGMAVIGAARLAGVGVGTIYREMENDPDFKEASKLAFTQFEHHHLLKWAEGKSGWQAHAAILQRLNARYRIETPNVQVTTNVSQNAPEPTNVKTILENREAREHLNALERCLARHTSGNGESAN
jgi:hypothetical protein